jgi:hypothetical protein
MTYLPLCPLSIVCAITLKNNNQDEGIVEVGCRNAAGVFPLRTDRHTVPLLLLSLSQMTAIQQHTHQYRSDLFSFRRIMVNSRLS